MSSALEGTCTVSHNVPSGITVSIMGAIASQITSCTIVYSTICWDAVQRKHQSSASLAFVRGIHREPVNSPHKWPVTRSFDVSILSWQKKLKEMWLCRYLFTLKTIFYTNVLLFVDKRIFWYMHPFLCKVLSELLLFEDIHDDVIKWKHFPRYWPFVRGIHRSPVKSPHIGQWRGTLMFSLICALNTVEK